MKKFRKAFIWIPVIGLPFLYHYHGLYGDTGLENPTKNFLSALLNAIVMAGIVVYFYFT